MFEIPGTAIKKVSITEEVIMGIKKAEYSEMASRVSKKVKSYHSEEHESDTKERAVNT